MCPLTGKGVNGSDVFYCFDGRKSGGGVQWMNRLVTSNFVSLDGDAKVSVRFISPISDVRIPYEFTTPEAFNEILKN